MSSAAVVIGALRVKTSQCNIIATQDIFQQYQRSFSYYMSVQKMVLRHLLLNIITMVIMKLLHIFQWIDKSLKNLSSFNLDMYFCHKGG